MIRASAAALVRPGQRPASGVREVTMSMFGAVRLYLVGQDAADLGASTGPEPVEDDQPYTSKPGAWRRWSVAGTGATEAARDRRRAKRGLVPQSLRPRVRLRH
jgi:hypothetical protein